MELVEDLFFKNWTESILCHVAHTFVLDFISLVTSVNACYTTERELAFLVKNALLCSPYRPF